MAQAAQRAYIAEFDELVSVLAYSGPRPEEVVCRLTWDDVGEQAIELARSCEDAAFAADPHAALDARLNTETIDVTPTPAFAGQCCAASSTIGTPPTRQRP